ncbi:TPA: LPXTG cell wall anchor domain-containing protein [Streptococcus suis]
MKKSTITKVGITLACVTLLGGIATPTTFSSPSDIVHAEETNQQPISVAVIAISETDGPLSHHYITINPGETKTIDAPKVEGWKLDQYTKPTYELTYDRALKIRNSSSNGFVWVQFWMIKDVAPDTPVEQPVEQPVEKPITYRIHYYLNDVVENGGTPSYTDIALFKEEVISKGETIVEVAPHIDGYAVAGNNTISVTYDHFTGDNVWHDADWYPADGFLYNKIETPIEQPVETPTDQPVEQPAEKPVDQPIETPIEQPVEKPAEVPVEQPVDTPAEQPVEQPAEKPTKANNTGSKAQTVATTNNKEVDNSTPAMNAIKPEGDSQTTAKTLPKTGDSSSMHLVLGGLLFGLSGLGLAAPSRKRD